MMHLLESGPHAPRGSRAWPMVSVVFHTAMIVAAVVATARVPAARVFEVTRTSLVYASPARSTAPAPAAGVVPTQTRPAIVAPAVAFAPVALRFPELTPSAAIEPMPMQPSAGQLAPSGILPGTLPGDGEVHTARSVDRPVLPDARNPQPEYPALLRASGLEGEVLVRFIVDAAGRVEAASIEIASASHLLFGDAVRRWLLLTRYRPAEVSGTPVRQRVEQRVEFQLAGSGG